MPVVKALLFRMSPEENEELALDVLALKCYCFVMQGRSSVSCRELLGAPAFRDNSDVRVQLPGSRRINWPIRRLHHHVTAKLWRDGSWRKHVRAEPGDVFFINGKAAPFWDGCADTSPPIFVQEKQRLEARRAAVLGRSVPKCSWVEIEAEMTKCELRCFDDLPPLQRPLFLFCTDEDVAPAAKKVPDRVIVVGRQQLDAFYGSILTSIRASSLSEVSATSASK
jgi:hypothetical protein